MRMPGSDLGLLRNRGLPMLPAGVLIHIHDIFLPFDYPPIWGWRAYNEQQGIVPLLAAETYRPLFSTAWADPRLGAPPPPSSSPPPPPPTPPTPPTPSPHHPSLPPP